MRANIGIIPQTDLGYTGQRNLDSGIGLMDYRARFYSSSLGRFIQPDTITPDMTQGLNRYSYVNNNPVNFNDPSGHARCDEEGNCMEGNKKTTGVHAEDYAGNNGNRDDLQDEINGSGNDDSGEKNCIPAYGQWICDFDALVDDFNQDTPHYYTVTTVICPASWHCTAEEAMDYASRFQYPGQLFWHPAVNNGNYSVMWGDFFPGTGYYDTGAITVDSSNGGMTLTNRTKPPHIFCCGSVANTVSENADGSWSVTTVGQGTNTNTFMAFANTVVGVVAFQVLQVQTLEYAAVSQVFK